MTDTIHLLGAAIGIGAEDQRTVDGPDAVMQSMQAAPSDYPSFVWDETIRAKPGTKSSAALNDIISFSQSLAKATQNYVESQQAFIVIGGDHASAIGTWSGVSNALAKEGKRLGLLWIDAHMDAHTAETSSTGNIHGMPVAVLLGHGNEQLKGIATHSPALQANAIAQLGIRSFEAGEENLLTDLNIHIAYDTDVTEKGIEACMQTALMHLQQHCDVLGISIDLDGFDPADAPGVGTLEPNGIPLQDFLKSLAAFKAQDIQFIGAEITEYNPSLDKDDRTLETLRQCMLGLAPLL